MMGDVRLKWQFVGPWVRVIKGKLGGNCEIHRQELLFLVANLSITAWVTVTSAAVATTAAQFEIIVQIGHCHGAITNLKTTSEILIIMNGSSTLQWCLPTIWVVPGLNFRSSDCCHLVSGESPPYPTRGSGPCLALVSRPRGTFHPPNGGNRGIAAIGGFFLRHSGKPHYGDDLSGDAAAKIDADWK